MLDTPNRPNTQEPASGNAQPPMSPGDIMMTCVEPDVAKQNAIKLAAREAIDRLPNVSWADKGFLGALVGRLNFTSGTVRDSHEYLAQWFNVSLGVIRKRRRALRKHGFIIECERTRVDGGDDVSEIALPAVAQTVERTRMSQMGHPPMSHSGRPEWDTTIGNPSLGRLEEKKEEEGGVPPVANSTFEERPAAHGELVPVESLGDGLASLPPKARAAMTDPFVQLCIKEHLKTVPREAVLQATLRACRAAAGEKIRDPAAYLLKVLSGEIAAERGATEERINRQPARSSGGKLSNRGTGNVLTVNGYGGTAKTVLSENDLARVMDETGLDAQRAYYELQTTAEPYTKKVTPPTAKRIADETIARVNGKPTAEVAAKSEFAAALKRVEAEECREEMERRVAQGKVVF